MAKVDTSKLSEWDQPPLPVGGGAKWEKGPAPRRLGLIHIMISLVYFALLSWSGRQIMDSNALIHRIVFAVLIGLGLCSLGLWVVMSVTRFSFFGWILFVVGYMTITGFTTTFLAIPTLPILIGAIIYLSVRKRSNDQDALLWILTVAAGQGMPLSPGVRAFSGQVSGIYRIWVDSLADLLDRGVSLPEALDSIPKIFTRRTALLIRLGCEAGDPALGLRDAVACREAGQPTLHAIGGRMAYLGWVATVGLSIVGFVLYFIVPKFEAIFKDFGMLLPELTILVIRASHVAINYTWILSLGFMVLLAYAMTGYFRSGDLAMPGFDRLLGRRHSLMILRSLAVVVSAGRPIPPALSSLSRRYPADWVRRKLARAAADTNEGMDWIEALHLNGLLRSSDVGVLASAKRVGNLPWALRELAETGERRWAYRLQAWNQVLFVATMLVLGFLFLILAVAFFLPLISLIERLAP